MRRLYSVGLGVAAACAAACCGNGNAQSQPANPPTQNDSGSPPGEYCTLVEQGFGPEGTVPVQVEAVVTGLEVPWGLAFLPDGDMLVTERPGTIRVVRGGTLSAPIAQVPISPGGEGGLLGLALHPEFDENRLFYIYFTASGPGGTENRIERWSLSEQADSASRESEIITGIPAALFHNGGRIRFGPDGMLFAATGDARDPQLAQSTDTIAGKLLRLTPDGQPAPGNPAGHPHLLLGIRNTQGFDWTPAGELIVTDHGPSGEMGRSGHDEVNRPEPGDNLGWPTTYGCQTKEGMLSPSLTWEEAVPPGGAAFYTGDRIPGWKGSLLVGTLGSRHLHRVVFSDASPRRVASHEVYFQGDPPDGHGRLREVMQGPDGALYVTTSNCDGRGTCPPDKDRILRITQ